MVHYIVQGNVQAQKLLDPRKKKDPLNAAILRAILANSSPSISIAAPVANIADYINSAFASNLNNNAEQYALYGELFHPDGLPKVGGSNGDSSTNAVDFITDEAEISSVQAIIEAEINEPVDIIYYAYDRAQLSIITNAWLHNDAGYILHNRYDERVRYGYGVNDFSIVGDSQIYRKTTPGTFNGTLITFTASKMEEYLSYDPQADDDPFNDEDEAEYSWREIRDVNGNPITIDVSIDISIAFPGITNLTYLHQVEYFTTSTRDHTIWFYNQATNTYPSIHLDVPSDAIENGAYPISMLIEDGQRIDKDGLGKNYRIHTEKLLKKLGMDIEDVMDSMVDPDDPNNLEDVRDAYILFSADLNTDEQAGLAYIYEFFRASHYADLLKSFPPDQTFWIANQADPYRYASRTFKTVRTKLTVGYRCSTIEVLTGDVNTYNTIPDVTILIVDGAEIDPNNNGRITKTETAPGSGVFVDVGKVTIQTKINTSTYDSSGLGYNDHLYIIRKQLTTTTFVQIVVIGLEHYTGITKYSSEYRTFNDSVIATVEHLDTGQFYLPLTRGNMARFNTMTRSDILYDSLTFVVQTLSIEKLPWYTNSAFLGAIRIIVFIVTFGGGSNIIDAIIDIIIQIVINKLIIVGLEIIADLIGGDVALVIAAIAAVYAIYNYGDTEKVFDLLDASDFLRGATLMTEAINNNIADDYADLEKAMELHEELMETEQEKLDNLHDLLGPNTQTEIYDLITNQPFIDLTESPTQFYNRSVHVTNPGVLSLSTIDNYVGNLLVLPSMDTFPETTGVA